MIIIDITKKDITIYGWGNGEKLRITDPFDREIYNLEVLPYSILIRNSFTGNAEYEVGRNQVISINRLDLL